MSDSRDPVDWELAIATGIKTAAGGPAVTPDRAAEEVAGLRAAAEAAKQPVSDITGLPLAHDALVDVVDRAGWVRSNTTAMKQLTASIRRPEGPALLRSATAKVTAVQLGLVFGWMSSKVLGQFEALVPPGQQPRLLLVAPNILSVGESLGFDADGFRMWVCVHEETHRQQFTGVPWMGGYFEDLVSNLIRDLDVGPAEMANRLAQSLRDPDRGSGMAVFHSPQMRSHMEKLLGLMSLLEGHADWVMDQSHEVVPQADEFRAVFEQRRRNPRPIDAILRRLLGLEAKLAQYRDGAAFVRAVVAEVGTEGLAAVWEEAENVPSIAEIHDPRSWLDRVIAA